MKEEKKKNLVFPRFSLNLYSFITESCEILSQGRRQEIVRGEERDSCFAKRGIVICINVVMYDDDMQAGTKITA